ncbi:hypothetical protein [Paenibacillus sp.]|uniref:hypothetical protein n=1 Tax=Paenibacillus sp. TaxID=58172 RepID=UPI002811C4D7|nr:hypothetical protein [Paenibacillus sp.]
MKREVRALSFEQLRTYREQGYLVLRNVFAEKEAEVMQVECDRLLTLPDYTNPYNVRAGQSVTRTAR